MDENCLNRSRESFAADLFAQMLSVLVEGPRTCAAVIRSASEAPDREGRSALRSSAIYFESDKRKPSEINEYRVNSRMSTFFVLDKRKA